jgi:tetratricopeptide (TPR) repeat protein
MRSDAGALAAQPARGRVAGSLAGFAAILALLGAASCAGDKQEKTTPDKISPARGDSQSMTDRDPADTSGGGSSGGSAGGPNVGGASGNAASGGPGAAPADSADPASRPPGATAEQINPTVTMPSYDPEPSVAKAQVDQHLQVARTALASATPDPDTALREARLALGIDAANVDAAAMVAFAYYHKKLYDTAELVLDDLFKREAAKQNANVYYVYGLVYDHTNRPEQAVLSFKKAVELNPEHASALVNLGVHQLQNSQYAEAVDLFERLVKQFGRTDAVTLTSLGSAYRGRAADYPTGTPDHDDNVRRAEAAYKRALQSAAGYGPAYYNLGLLYLDNDPFPGLSDTLLRLGTAKSYFEQYKNMAGVDMKLYDDRMKDVTKAIKRAEKQLKKTKGSGGSEPTPATTPTAPAPKAKAGAKRRSNP